MFASCYLFSVHVVIQKYCFDCSFASVAICLQSVGIHVSGLYLFHLDSIMGFPIEVIAIGDKDMLCRPCVDCGKKTGRFCDYCKAADRLPDERWAHGQLTPLCSDCDNEHDQCHFCRGQLWCTPPPSTQASRAT